jgi:hypothetical protein
MDPSFPLVYYVRGHIVAWLVEAIYYELDGRRFDSQ